MRDYFSTPMNRILKSLVKSIKNTNLVWRYGYNFTPVISYSSRTENKLTRIETQIVNSLNRDGIAFTSVDCLLRESCGFNELNASTESILEDRKEEITKLKSKANDEKAIGDKTFNVELLGSEITFDADNIFAKFAINDSLLNIANAYFQMYAKLRYYNIWKTFASASQARESQLWHFDREDKYILKLFLYLDDVDEGAGPFTYAPGTHKKGKLSKLIPKYFLEGGVRRTTDEQMNAVYPKEKWIKAIGKKGTIIFADTRGYHKGGEARTNDRLIYTCMYTSQASESKKLITYPTNMNTETLNEKQLRALYF